MRNVRRMLDRAPLGRVLAVAFGAALAFALFAMPAWRLAQLVGATGLPAVLPAAAPPLGATARALAMVLGAICGGGGVRALFTWLERPAPPVRVARPDLPVLRRADTHPDAPSCRPILAAADLGAPLDEAPEAVWREETRRLAVVPAPVDELLLDHPLDDTDGLAIDHVGPAFQPIPFPVSANQSPAELIARLEGDLQRRGGQLPRATPALLRDIVGLRASA